MAFSFVADADKVDRNLTDEHTNLMYRLALRFPRLKLPRSMGTQGVAACYDVTEDWTPIYDKSSLPGYYMAIGTSGNQFKNAPVVGGLMARLIDVTENDKSANHDVNPIQYRLDTAPGSQRSLSIGSFSRKRPVHTTSNCVFG
jgi:sarcosine oxidase subunit beta